MNLLKIVQYLHFFITNVIYNLIINYDFNSIEALRTII